MHEQRRSSSSSSSSCASAAAIQCANCGGRGHVHRICNHPISSFGIICYRIRQSIVEFILVQRKDSLCYVEFIRGKYLLQNRGYIVKLLSNMTAQERALVGAGNFDALWYGFWQTDQTRTFMKEYEQSKSRYESLREGYFLRTADDDRRMVFFDLASALEGTSATYSETEWGFPKGRRNINESDMRCACREFREETGIDMSYIHVIGNVKPFEETFSGCNKVRYRHVYYLAHLKTHCDGGGDFFTPPASTDFLKQREIKCCCWFTFEEVMARIRTENVERRELFRRVNQWVLQHERCNSSGPPPPQPSPIVPLPTSN